MKIMMKELALFEGMAVRKGRKEMGERRWEEEGGEKGKRRRGKGRGRLTGKEPQTESSS